MHLFSNKYQKSSFFYSLSLSFIYLPLVLSILQTNMFIPNGFSNFFVFTVFSIVFVTTINYKILLTKKSVSSFSNFLLTPLNIFIMFLLAFLLPFEMRINSFLFSMVFLGIPWVIFFLWIWKKHKKALVLKKESLT